MDPKKFPTAAAFAEALIKAVDDEFKPPAEVASEDDETSEERGSPTSWKEQEAAEADASKKTPKRKATDAPGEDDSGGQPHGSRRTSGPWTKLADAPADVQKEIKRTADRFVSSTAPKEQREKFIAQALESHYTAAQRAKGKK